MLNPLMTTSPASAPPPPDGLGLLVVDMQTAFAPVIEGWSLLLKRCRFAIQAADLLGIPVAFTEQVPEKLGPTDSSLTGESKRAIFPKTSFSALQAPGLTTFCAEKELHHLLIIGIEIPVCIYQTVLDALPQDMEVTLLSDCLGARRPDDAHWAMRSLGNEGVHILPSETVFYAMLAQATDPRFPAFTKLVKEAGA